MASIQNLRSLDVEGSSIPLLVAGTSISAGYPSPAQDYFSGEINLSDYLIHDKTSTFIVRVSGDSMQGAGISDGDELIVNRARKPVDGSIVVAVLDGEMTVKRLRLTPTLSRGRGWALRPPGASHSRSLGRLAYS